MGKIIGMTPAYNDTKVLQAFFDSLDKNSPNIDYHLFCTNNCTDSTNSLIDRYLKKHDGERITLTLPNDLMTTIEEPYAGVGIARQYLLRRARRLAESQAKFSHALCIDTDIYATEPDGIGRMAEWGADLIGGSYLRPFPEGKYMASKFEFPKRGEYRLVEKIFYNICEPFITSAGFLMMSRRLLLDDRMHFFPIYKILDNGLYSKDTSEDFGFCLLAKSLGYKLYLDGTVKLTHLVGEKQRSFVALEPGQYDRFEYGQ